MRPVLVALLALACTPVAPAPSPTPTPEPAPTPPRLVFGPGPLQVWARPLSGAPEKHGQSAPFFDVWWSPDGERVFALIGGDDSVWKIVDVDRGRSITTVCVRGDAPPCP